MSEIEKAIDVISSHTQHFVPHDDLEALYIVVAAAEKLSEYETAEEEGRLYILPHGVNVGDCVYAIYRLMIDKASAIGINRIRCNEIPTIGTIISLSHTDIKKILEDLKKKESDEGV